MKIEVNFSIRTSAIIEVDDTFEELGTYEFYEQASWTEIDDKVGNLLVTTTKEIRKMNNFPIIENVEIHSIVNENNRACMYEN